MGKRICPECGGFPVIPEPVTCGQCRGDGCDQCEGGMVYEAGLCPTCRGEEGNTDASK